MFTPSSLSETQIANYANTYCDIFTYALYRELAPKLRDLKFTVITTDKRNWVFMCLNDKGTYISAEGWRDEVHLLDEELYSELFDENELSEDTYPFLYSFPVERFSDYSRVENKHLTENIKADAKKVATEYLNR